MQISKSNGVPLVSFRDPSGFLFTKDGSIYRQLNSIYKESYDLLVTSGLYRGLIDGGLLIPHDEVAVDPAEPAKAYKVIKPEMM